jgi:ElaB/YqjD/DUF883 family membrane-anchored ribosome-binding protein
MKEEIIKVLQSIDQTTELFYQQKEQEGYKNLEYTLDILIKTINEMLIYKKEKSDNFKDIQENKINEILTEAMNALEQKDTILLSDILNYDLKEALKELI